jgi:hypothetical protein
VSAASLLLTKEPQDKDVCSQLLQDDSSSIWGDSTLYDQVLKGSGSSDYSWLQSTHWWNSPGMTPCQSSLQRVRSKKSLLSNFRFLILDDDGLRPTSMTRGPNIIREDRGIPCMADCTDEDVLVDESDENKAHLFQGLCSNDVSFKE